MVTAEAFDETEITALLAIDYGENVREIPITLNAEPEESSIVSSGSSGGSTSVYSLLIMIACMVGRFSKGIRF